MHSSSGAVCDARTTDTSYVTDSRSESLTVSEMVSEKLYCSCKMPAKYSDLDNDIAKVHENDPLSC